MLAAALLLIDALIQTHYCRVEIYGSSETERWIGGARGACLYVYGYLTVSLLHELTGDHIETHTDQYLLATDVASATIVLGNVVLSNVG